MSNPIRIVPIGDDAYTITGLAQCDVQVHVVYRVPTDATETHNYHANIDGLPNYIARGASELGAAEAMCARLIADLTKPPLSAGEPSGPEALLVYLADNERVRREETTWRYDSPAYIESIAREEAYRAAAQIVHAAKVLAEPTEAQKRLWAGMAKACAEYDGTGRDAPPAYALGLSEAIKIGGAVIDRIVNESAEAIGWKPLPCVVSGPDETCDDKPSLSEVG